MTDWFSASLALQRQLIESQRATLNAAGKAMAAGEAMVRVHEAGRSMAEANMAAWNAWGRLWTGRP